MMRHAGAYPLGIPTSGGTVDAFSAADQPLGLPAGRSGAYALRALCVEVDRAVLGRYFEADDGEPLRLFRQACAERRAKVLRERGILLPEIALSFSDQLEPGAFNVLVRENLVRSGRVPAGAHFAATGEGVLNAFGLRVVGRARHPITYASASWIDLRAGGSDSLDRLGVTVVGAVEYLALEAVGAALDAVEELFGLDEVKQLLGELEAEHPALVEAVIAGGLVNVPELTDLLRRLVREHVKIRDMKLILEGVVEFAAGSAVEEDRTAWLNELHGFLRLVLSRAIITDVLSPSGKLRTFSLSDEVEDEFRSATAAWDRARSAPPLDTQIEGALRDAARAMFAPVLERGAGPVVMLVSSDIRPAVDEFFSRQFTGRSWCRTVAFEEVGNYQSLESVGVLAL